jgi:hypothetical protein
MSKHHNESIQMVQLFYVVKQKMEAERVCQRGKHGKYEEDLYYKKNYKTEEDNGRTRFRGGRVAGAIDRQTGR